MDEMKCSEERLHWVAEHIHIYYINIYICKFISEQSLANLHWPSLPPLQGDILYEYKIVAAVVNLY